MGQHLERCTKAVVEATRPDAMCQVAQFACRRGDLGDPFRDQGVGVVRREFAAGIEPPLSQSHRDGKRHQTLLGDIVQVPFQFAAFFVAHLLDASTALLGFTKGACGLGTKTHNFNQ